MRIEGKSNQEISEATGFHVQHITHLVSKYKAEGIAGIVENRYSGNHRNLSMDEEAQLLDRFELEAKNGKPVSISDIKEAYRKAVGHSIGGSQIYYVLYRHDLQNITPKSTHPKKRTERL